MIPGLVLVLAVAVVDWIAVAKGWRKVELTAKPLTLVVLFLLFLISILVMNRPIPLPIYFFGAGLLFSLAGDILLMFSQRWFLPGLVAFLLAQLAYIVGFNIPLPDVAPLWSIGLSLVVALTAARLLRRIIAGVVQMGLRRMVIPVAVYGMVITIMLVSAVLTIYREDWGTLPAGLASLGAALFFTSDVILAWNKYVAPIKNGRLANMICYHVGQIVLTVAVIFQFTVS